MKRSFIAAGMIACTACTACAQIDSVSTVEVVPRPELDPRWLGDARTIVGRDLELKWSQSLSTVQLQIEETRRCRQVLHQPVDRVESVDRTVKHGALYWEYGTGAALLGLGVAALIRPQAFSPQAVDTGGSTRRDTATGLRLGGIFTALGAGVIGIGAYDTVRGRDSVSVTRAYQLTSGEQTPCPTPQAPLAGAEVRVEVGSWSTTSTTDADGHVLLGLPAESKMGIALPEPEPEPERTLEEAPGRPLEPGLEDPEPEPEPEPEPPQASRITATVTVDGRVATFEIVAPLSSEQARDRAGSSAFAPASKGPPPPAAAAP